MGFFALAYSLAVYALAAILVEGISRVKSARGLAVACILGMSFALTGIVATAYWPGRGAASYALVLIGLVSCAYAVLRLTIEKAPQVAARPMSLAVALAVHTATLAAFVTYYPFDVAGTIWTVMIAVYWLYAGAMLVAAWHLARKSVATRRR
jgi:hypothetical protein